MLLTIQPRQHAVLITSVREGDRRHRRIVDRHAVCDVLLQIVDEEGAVGRARAGDEDAVDADAAPAAVGILAWRDAELGDERDVDVRLGLAAEHLGGDGERVGRDGKEGEEGEKLEGRKEPVREHDAGVEMW